MTQIANQNAPTPAGQALQSIGSLAVQIPGATAIFRKLKLDFCCGGQKPLAKACEEKGLNTDEVLQTLNALQRSDVLPPPPRQAIWWTTSCSATTRCIASNCPNSSAWPAVWKPCTATTHRCRTAWPRIWKRWSKNYWSTWPRKNKSCSHCSSKAATPWWCNRLA